MHWSSGFFQWNQNDLKELYLSFTLSGDKALLLLLGYKNIYLIMKLKCNTTYKLVHKTLLVSSYYQDLAILILIVTNERNVSIGMYVIAK